MVEEGVVERPSDGTGTSETAFAHAIEQAAHVLRDAATRRTEAVIILAYHGDADGVCAARCALAALASLPVRPIPIAPNKGEHAHSPAFLARLAELAPDFLVVLDMGSRPEPLLPNVPTLIVDHHRPAGFPPDAQVLTSYGREPPEPAALLAYTLGTALTPLNHVAWVAAVGTMADLGASAPFGIVQDARRHYGRKTLSTVAGLLNAAKRAPEHDVATALEALSLAAAPKEIVSGASPAAQRLHAYRETVNREVARAGRVAPTIANGIALIVVNSPAQVHALLAIRWVRRLQPNIVVVANIGYRPGWVHFAVRSAPPRDLLAFLAPARALVQQGDVGYGHERATGGVVPEADFAAIVKHWGFPTTVINQIARPAR